MTDQPLGLANARWRSRRAALWGTAVLAVLAVLVTTAVRHHEASAAAHKERQAVTTWLDLGGREHQKDLATDIQALAMAEHATAFDGLQDGCVDLAEDLGRSQAGGPIPDAAAQKHWSAALTVLNAADALCFTGLRSQSPTALRQVGMGLAPATQDLTETAARLKSLGLPTSVR